MATLNVARFLINGTPSEDVDGDRGFDTTANTLITLTLEKNPAVDAITVTYELPDSANADSPLASLYYTANTFVENGAKKITLTSPNAAVTFNISPASEISSFPVRCTVVTARGTHVFERIIVIRKNGLRMTVPVERQEYGARGWSDALNELTKAVADGGISTPLVSSTQTGVLAAFTAGSPRVLTSDGSTAGGVWMSYASFLLAIQPVGPANTVLWSNGSSNSFSGSPRLSTSLSIGTTTAAAGALRVSNNGVAVAARNAANTADLNLVATDNSNNGILGSNSSPGMYFDAGSAHYFRVGGVSSMTVGSGSTAVTVLTDIAGTTAVSGWLRGRNNQVLLTARNAANNADINVLATNASDQVRLGIASNSVAIGAYNTSTVYIGGDGTAGAYNTAFVTGGVYLSGGGYNILNGVASLLAYSAGPNSSATGLLRGLNNTLLIGARNVANDADIQVLSTDSANRIKIGGAQAVHLFSENAAGTRLALTPIGGSTTVRSYSEITRAFQADGVLSNITLTINLSSILLRALANDDAGVVEIEAIGCRTSGTIQPHYRRAVMSFHYASSTFVLGAVNTTEESFNAGQGECINALGVSPSGATSLQAFIVPSGVGQRGYMLKVTVTIHSALS